MSTNNFFEKLSHNWKAKIICFVIAILVYFIHQMSLLSKKTFTLPLTVEQSGSMTPSEGYEKHRYVKVTVRGKTEQLATITESDFRALVDISYKDKEGSYELPVIIQPSERLMLMEPLEIRPKPEKINLTVEEKQFKFQKITPSISGEVARGYELVAVTVEPHSIRLDGPRNIVQQTNFIGTEAIDVEGLTRDTTRIVRVLNENSHLSIHGDSNVRAKISVRPIGMTKAFQKIELTFTGLPENLQFTAEDDTVDIVLEGDLLVLENITASQIEAGVNCSSITEPGSFTIPVNIRIPAKTSLTSQSIESVRLTVEEKIYEEPEAIITEENEGEENINSLPENGESETE